MAMVVLVLAGSTPASAQAGGQRVNTVTVRATVGVVHDSNVLQINKARFDADLSDTVVSPGVAASISRTVGRNSFSLAASGAYDLHRRFKFLDQVNIAGSGEGTLALTAYCVFSPTGNLTVQQTNLSGAAAIKNAQTVQDYSGTFACRRPFGFFPSITVGYRAVTNSQATQALFDQHTLSASAGIGYAVPTIGSLLVSIGETRIRQPNRSPLDGGEDGSDVFGAGLAFDRAVAPRLSFSLGARYLSVDPLRATTPGFAGAGYSARVNYHPSPRITLSASALRDIAGSGDVAVSYVLATTYGLTGGVTLSRRTSFDLSLQRFDRDYRGESLIFFPVLRGRERGDTLGGGVTYLLGTRFQLRAFLLYTDIDAQGSFYDFNRLQLGLSAGARF